MSFSTLQVGRAIAAIAVVIFHANTFFVPQRLHGGDSAARIFDMGYAGVEYFFVLSGFIMVLSHRHQFGDASCAGNFLTKRVVRIIPFYWAVMLVLLAMMLVYPSAADGRFSVENLLHSLFLVPNSDGTPLMIHSAWTLSHEFLFYFVFTALFFSLRWGAALFGFWMLGVALTQGLGAIAYPFDFLFSIYNLLFLLGIVAAFAHAHVKPPLGWTLALGGAAIFLANGIVHTYALAEVSHVLRTVIYGVAACMMVTGFAGLELAGRIRSNRGLVFLGDASYSIYLVHGIALSIFTKIVTAAKLNQHLTPFLSLTLLVVLATLAGCLAHLWIERPLLAALRPSRRVGTPVTRG
ncbi:acyltransferase family protein [Salipiger mangrovisoli]|nr:acyltransferase [Salipiger mangrovisoli]